MSENGRKTLKWRRNRRSQEDSMETIVVTRCKECGNFKGKNGIRVNSTYEVEKQIRRGFLNVEVDICNSCIIKTNNLIPVKEK